MTIPHDLLITSGVGRRLSLKAPAALERSRLVAATELRPDGPAVQLWDVNFMECLATQFERPILAQVFAPDQSKS